MKNALTILIVLLLAACARPQAAGFSAPHPDAATETIFIATMRSAGQRGQMFGQTRAPDIGYAQALISIPPTHQLGNVERGTGQINAARYFAPLSVRPLPDTQALTRAIKAKQTNPQEPLLIFVHGYNNTLEDAAFRLAQIQHDFALTNPALLFSWPSAGDPRGYVYDRDSVLFARSDFARLLENLNNAGQRRVLILAHSMGGSLVMEALRQLKLEGKAATVSSLDGVVLMSPDIDPDIFRRQVQEIGKLPEPFVVMTTQKDRVLNFATLLTGKKPRLGRIQNNDEVKGLGVTVLDFSRFDIGENFGHMVPVSSPEAITFLRKLMGGVAENAEAFSRYVLLGEPMRREPRKE